MQEALSEASDLPYRPAQRVVIEEVGRGVGQLMRRAVEVAGSVGGIDRVAERDLVRHDEDRRLGPFQQLLERGRVPARCLVE
jgi:hypothetical protein